MCRKSRPGRGPILRRFPQNPDAIPVYLVSLVRGLSLCSNAKSDARCFHETGTAVMRLVQHPFVQRDLIGIADHIVDVTQGDLAAAARRLDEVDVLLAAILENPLSGMRLHGKLEGWLVRHGGAGNRLTVVFRPDLERATLYVALVAFGGKNWMEIAPSRSFLSTTDQMI